MVVKLYESDGVKVFNVTADKVLPQWVQKKKGRKLSRDEGYARHIELLQDFGCPSATHRIKIAPDQQHIFTCGVHAPRLRVYDLHNLSLKFERHFDSELVDFQILSEDYSKVAILCTDRSLAFHARGGHHFATRVPKAGRTLAYLPHTAEMIVGGSAAELWRVNLQEGRFLAPLPVAAPAVNVLGVSPTHGMLAAGCEGGVLECFDPRSRSSLSATPAAGALGAAGDAITALRFDDSGLFIAAGTSGGKVGVFDLRKPEALVVRDHLYDAPIVDLKFHRAAGDHTGRQRVVSADTHVVKVWDKDTGEAYTAIEPQGGAINDVCVWPGSGLLMLATDAPKVPAFFVPSLGPAPPWCSFLEAVVEDLEAAGGGDAGAVVYDDYRFVTKAELAQLELEHLVGTPMLRAYMHGFFVDARLYRKAQARLEPFAYDTYREKRVAQRLEQERQSRIATVRKLPKVNAGTHVRLQAATMEPAAGRKGDAAAAAATALLEDDRFTALFDDEDFAVDEASRTFKELNPNAGNRRKTDQERLIEEHFEAVEASGSDGSDADGEGDAAGAHSMEEAPLSVAGAGPGVRKVLEGAPGARGGRTRMLVGKEAASGDLFARRESVAAVREMPLGERAAANDDAPRPRFGRGGSGRGPGVWRGGGRSAAGVSKPDAAGGRGGGRGRGRGGGRGGGRSGPSRGGRGGGGVRGRGGGGRGRGRGRGR